MRGWKLAALGAVALATGCDYSGDFLFAEPSETVPGNIHLGELTPSPVGTLDELRAAAVYGEVGATGTSAQGGVTFTFTGTGSSVCLLVDPELAHWSQSVSTQQPNQKYSYPDNILDDGDLDLEAGLSVYYNGSPNETFGNFAVRYADSLGNVVPIELNECRILNYFSEEGGHSGRGRPEWCNLSGTAEGISYTVALETFSTPIDDNRLAYGIVLADAPCRTLLNNFSNIEKECWIRGEALMPDENWDYRTDPIRAVGFDAVSSLMWPGTLEYEDAFCASVDGTPTSTELRDYCINEAAQLDCDDEDVHCFCGDPSDTPTGGSQ